MSVALIVAAAGQGRRMQEKMNKQYLQLAGRPLLGHTLKTCLDTALFTQIIVAVTPGEEEIFCRDVLLPLFPGAQLTVVPGGRQRQDSVFNALAVLDDHIQFVCIHDGARPLADQDLFIRTLVAAREHGAAIAAVPVKDTIKSVDTLLQVQTTPARDFLWAVQTPQTFRRDWLTEAHQRAKTTGLQSTDDAALLENYGYPVFVVPASYKNIKVTTPEDLLIAEVFLEGESKMRIGTGYDVHRLVPDRPLILGGVTVPYEFGLLGHSDADVLVHALIDALLGAMALGDLGKHFPDTDPAYRGISSLKLLEHVRNLIHTHGYGIGNIDSVIIAQKPMLAPFILQMRENIASTLQIPVELVSIKATTTEGLGFTGTGEGMAAQTSVLLHSHQK